jgi:hypothetical protein
MAFRSPWKNPDTGMTYNIGPRSQGMLGGKATPQNPMNAYFTQLADPKYRKAMQQQNLFSNLLNFGAQMSAAGAPSLDPGYAGRTSAGAWAGLGKGLMSGNQDYRNQMMNAIKLKTLMSREQRDTDLHKAKLAQVGAWQTPTPTSSPPQMTPDPLGNVAGTVSKPQIALPAILEPYRGTFPDATLSQIAQLARTDPGAATKALGSLIQTQEKHRIDPPRTEAERIAVARASIPPQETKEEEKYRGVLVDDYKILNEDARGAESTLQNINIAKTIDVKTGQFEPFKNLLASSAKGLGLDPEDMFGLDDPTNAQAYTAALQTMVLTKMQAQKGPQTESDQKLIATTVGTMKNTNEANRFILDANEAVERQKILKRNFWIDHRRKNQTFEGAEAAWAQFSADTPFLAKNPTSGRPVFFANFAHEFRRANMATGKKVTSSDILSYWRQKYGR